jgi:hypothetical protein
MVPPDALLQFGGAGLRDFIHKFPGAGVGRVLGDVGLRNDATHQSGVVHHGYSADTMGLHDEDAVIDALTGSHGDDWMGHAGSSLLIERIFALCNKPRHDVTIRHDAEDPSINRTSHNRNFPAIVFNHHLRDLLQAGFGRAADRFTRHHFFNKHRCTPFDQSVVISTAVTSKSYSGRETVGRQSNRHSSKALRRSGSVEAGALSDGVSSRGASVEYVSHSVSLAVRPMISPPHHGPKQLEDSS